MSCKYFVFEQGVNKSFSFLLCLTLMTISLNYCVGWKTIVRHVLISLPLRNAANHVFERCCVCKFLLHIHVNVVVLRMLFNASLLTLLFEHVVNKFFELCDVGHVVNH